MSIYVGIDRYKKINGLSNASFKYADDYAQTKSDVDFFEECGGYPPFGVIYDKLDLSHHELNSTVTQEEFNYKDLEKIEDDIYYKYLEEYKTCIQEKENALKEIDATNATKKLERQQLWFVKRDYKLGNVVKRLLGYKEHQWFYDYVEKEVLLKFLDNLQEEEYLKKHYENAMLFLEDIKEEIKKDGEEYVYYIFVN